jgi:hypothetical protein
MIDRAEQVARRLLGGHGGCEHQRRQSKGDEPEPHRRILMVMTRVSLIAENAHEAAPTAGQETVR